MVKGRTTAKLGGNLIRFGKGSAKTPTEKPVFPG
jgi:hypothetical protein